MKSKLKLAALLLVLNGISYAQNNNGLTVPYVQFKPIPTNAIRSITTIGDTVQMDNAHKMNEIQLIPFMIELGELGKTDPGLAIILNKYVNEIKNENNQQIWP